MASGQVATAAGRSAGAASWLCSDALRVVAPRRTQGERLAAGLIDEVHLYQAPASRPLRHGPSGIGPQRRQEPRHSCWRDGGVLVL